MDVKWAMQAQRSGSIRSASAAQSGGIKERTRCREVRGAAERGHLR